MLGVLQALPLQHARGLFGFTQVARLPLIPLGQIADKRGALKVIPGLRCVARPSRGAACGIAGPGHGAAGAVGPAPTPSAAVMSARHCRLGGPFLGGD